LNLQKNGFTRSLQKIPARISFPEVNEKRIDFLQEILWVCNPRTKTYVEEV
jgi:hypothetical protein